MPLAQLLRGGLYFLFLLVGQLGWLCELEWGRHRGAGMLVLGQGLRLGAHVAPEGGEALDSGSARGTGCFDGRMLMVLECFHVILPGSFGSGHRIRRNQTSRDSGINVTMYQSVLIFITSCDQAVLEVFSLCPRYFLTGTSPPSLPPPLLTVMMVTSHSHSPALFLGSEGRGRSDGHAAEEDWLVRAH